MAAKEPEAVKMMQLRKLILDYINRIYDTPLQVSMLYRVMCGIDEHYDFSLFRKDLMYLNQKGYVRFVDEAIGGADSFRKKYVGLTAEGKEIADKTHTDSALEI